MNTKDLSKKVCIMHAIVTILFISMCVMACLFYYAMTTYEVCTCCKVDIGSYLEMINGMVGFWMSILTIILMICGIWQYLHIQKVDNKIKESEDNLKKVKDQTHTLLNVIKSISDISILLRSIGALNDPIMLLSDNERKREVRKYFELIIDKLKVFVEALGETKDYESGIKRDIDKELPVNLRIILINLTLCVGRIQVMYSTPKENLKMRKFIEDNNKKRESINNKATVEDYNDLIDRMYDLLSVM